MDKKSVISIQNLTKKFGDTTVLNNLNFEIYENSITTVLGFSGAGKSTLLKLMLGLIGPTNGSITVLGQDLTKLSNFNLREFRTNFGMVFQYAALFDSMTAFENVAFPMREFTKMNQTEIEERVHSLFNSAGLKESSFHSLPAALSGGMKKRVGLARALALEPRVMLYDEPTSGLDPITTRMVNQLIKETSVKNQERGLTSVIISHDIRATIEISDYIAFLDHGNIVEYLPTKEFERSENPVIKRFLSL